MSREPIHIRRIFQTWRMLLMLLCSIRHRFQCLSSWYGQVAHVLRTLPPVAARVLLPRAAPRLACVKPAASVHPEPGSNSSLYISYITKLDLTIRFSKKLTLSFILFLVLASLYLVFQYCQWSTVISQTDCKYTHFFLLCKHFQEKFRKYWLIIRNSYSN